MSAVRRPSHYLETYGFIHRRDSPGIFSASLHHPDLAIHIKASSGERNERSVWGNRLREGIFPQKASLAVKNVYNPGGSDLTMGC
jgi:hypothetical protein